MPGELSSMLAWGEMPRSKQLQLCHHRRPASAELFYWRCVTSCCGTYAIRKSLLVRVGTTLHNLKAPYTLSAPGSQNRPTTEEKLQRLQPPQNCRAPTAWNLGGCIEQYLLRHKMMSITHFYVHYTVIMMLYHSQESIGQMILKILAFVINLFRSR